MGRLGMGSKSRRLRERRAWMKRVLGNFVSDSNPPGSWGMTSQELCFPLPPTARCDIRQDLPLDPIVGNTIDLGKLEAMFPRLRPLTALLQSRSKFIELFKGNPLGRHPSYAGSDPTGGIPHMRAPAQREASLTCGPRPNGRHPSYAGSDPMGGIPHWPGQPPVSQGKEISKKLRHQPGWITHTWWGSLQQNPQEGMPLPSTFPRETQNTDPKIPKPNPGSSSRLPENSLALLRDWGVVDRVSRKRCRFFVSVFAIPKPGKEVSRLIVNAAPLNRLQRRPPHFRMPQVEWVRATILSHHWAMRTDLRHCFYQFPLAAEVAAFFSFRVRGEGYHIVRRLPMG